MTTTDNPPTFPTTQRSAESLQALHIDGEIDPKTNLPVLPHESMFWHIRKSDAGYKFDQGNPYLLAVYYRHLTPSYTSTIKGKYVKYPWYIGMFKKEKTYQLPDTVTVISEKNHTMQLYALYVINKADIPADGWDRRGGATNKMPVASLNEQSILETSEYFVHWWNRRADVFLAEADVREREAALLGSYPPRKLNKLGLEKDSVDE